MTKISKFMSWSQNLWVGANILEEEEEEEETREWQSEENRKKEKKYMYVHVCTNRHALFTDYDDV